jgi:hypothetical protein
MKRRRGVFFPKSFITNNSQLARFFLYMDS